MISPQPSHNPTHQEFWQWNDLTLQLSFSQQHCTEITPIKTLPTKPHKTFSSLHDLLNALKLLQLQPNGTPFQASVWNALQKIPPGTTQTYGQIASSIGHPSAARAVGSAVAANPCFLAIPCHRILPASGNIGQFRWGPSLKAKLLSAESSS